MASETDYRQTHVGERGNVMWPFAGAAIGTGSKTISEFSYVTESLAKGLIPPRCGATYSATNFVVKFAFGGFR